MADLVRIGNAVFDLERVVYAVQGDGKVTVAFEGGHKLDFKGDEAVEVWKAVDKDGSWRGENS